MTETDSLRGWRDASEVTSAVCSHREPEFGFDNPHWETHNNSVTLARRDPMPSSGFHRYFHTYAHTKRYSYAH